MTQRTLHSHHFHVAVIMDGNGRWALRRGRPRTAGHRAGATTVRSVVEAAAEPSLGITCLTLYAFSSANWARPGVEVRGLMRLLERYLESETETCLRNGIRLRAIGRRDRLPRRLARRIAEAEAATAGGSALTLRLAIDYSGRGAIARAAKVAVRAAESEVRPDVDEPVDEVAFDKALRELDGDDCPPGGVDLLIRTGGERRLSDFLLWECAYAELYFTPVLWPDFDAAELRTAVADFRGRERRFGRVLEEAV